MLSLVKIPEHGDTILSSRGGERTVRGNGDGIDVAGVTVVIGLQFELGKFPNLGIGISNETGVSTKQNFCQVADMFGQGAVEREHMK